MGGVPSNEFQTFVVGRDHEREVDGPVRQQQVRCQRNQKLLRSPSVRILYLSCHAVLEADEIQLFRGLGHYVFSPGAYVEPRNPGDASLRPPIDMDYDQDDREAWQRICASHVGKDGKDHLTVDFVNRFDAVIVMHLPRWVVRNWPAMRHKPVVWRTIGQSVSQNERQLKPFRQQGMKIVRYSPREPGIPNYIGADAFIRFYKDPEEFGNWNGKDKSVITLAQSMKKRGSSCNFEFFEEVTQPFSRKLFGPHNEDAGDLSYGRLSYDELKAALRNHRVYFYTGTHPASYTLNFIEAWMTGIPIVAIGPNLGNNRRAFPEHHLYEVPDLLGDTGFCSDDPEDLQDSITFLMENDIEAQALSERARERAVTYFGKDKAMSGWQAFLEAL